MLLLAHRGYSDQYPENTMKAFLEAIKKGFNGIETDVHKTKDGQLVLCHDEKINRTSNGQGYIKDYTYEELCQFRFNYKFKDFDEKIPLLEELLDLAKGKDVILNIELKTDKIHYQGIEEEVYQMVKDKGMLKQVMFSSFYLPSLLKLKEIDESLYLGYLFEDDYQKNKQLCFQYHLNGHPREDFLNEDEIAEFKMHNLDLNTWTVKNRFRFEYFLEHLLHAAIANRFFQSDDIL